MSSLKERYEMNWVKQLHNRSWEMELLIVGFALLVLLRVPNSLIQFFSPIEATVSNPFVRALIPLGFTLIIATYIMSFNLGIHIVLRGYWIGIVGLNSVFPDGVNFEKLNFHPRFEMYLNRKLRNLETTAIRVDRICSAIFAFTFLLIFIFISITLYFLSMALIISPIVLLPESLRSAIELQYSLFCFFSYLFFGGLLAIDFLSLGMLKKIKWNWFARPYYYISTYFRYVTGFAFYQSIYYTLISNVPRKLIASILTLYVFITLGYFITRYDETVYFPLGTQAAEFKVSQKHYMDTVDPERYIKSPVISTKIVTNDYFELFIPYSIAENDSLKKYCGGLIPLKSIGFSFKGRIVLNADSSAVNNIKKAELAENLNAILACVSDLYELRINDNVLLDVAFLFYNHPHRDEPGFLTVIQTNTLETGLHRLVIRKKYDYDSEKDERDDTVHIPFWIIK
ncbi:MAG: hypothetical protein DWQ10_00905 [Calditrichaeota bacterium]|nr:MAG: hypothetical protein DWQ10_00905 [Calditrichota bacterium]